MKHSILKKAGILLALIGMTAFSGTTLADGEQASVSDYLQFFEGKTDTNQVVFVRHTEGTQASVSFYARYDGTFTPIFETTGYIGRNGLGKSYEGDQMTPLGIYDLKTPFGIKADPGSIIGYTQVTDDLYWCGDEAYYNQMISINEHPHSCAGEHLINYSPEYNYAMFVGYNEEGTYGNGSAIFLHCTGSNTSTAGCIAIPEEYMIDVIQCVTSGAKICIF